jgi:acyl carrier protein
MGAKMDEDVRKTVRDFLRSHGLADSGPLTDEESLLKRGLIDSMGVVELLAFLRKVYEIDIQPGDVTPDNMDSVERISRFVERRRQVR